MLIFKDTSNFIPPWEILEIIRQMELVGIDTSEIEVILPGSYQFTD